MLKQNISEIVQLIQIPFSLNSVVQINRDNKTNRMPREIESTKAFLGSSKATI